jgi:hypothetical protein
MNQQVFKAKKKAAEGGHRLLKKKADALKVSPWATLSIWNFSNSVVQRPNYHIPPCYPLAAQWPSHFFSPSPCIL